MASPTKDIFDRSGKQVIENIRALMSQSGANATGKTSASLEHLATEERLLVLGGAAFGLNNREDAFVSGGRAAGGVPPFQSIAEWAIARGIVSDPQRGKNRINAIRFAIANRGTRLYQKNTVRNIYQSVITDDFVEDVIDQASGVFAQNVLSDVVKAFKQ